MVIFNLLSIMVSTWIIMAINNKFLVPALRDRYIFDFQDIAHELSALSKKGRTKVGSPEYKAFLDLLYSSINLKKEVRISVYANRLLHHDNTGIDERKINTIIIRIKITKNRELAALLLRYLHLSRKMLLSDTRTLRVIIFPVFDVIVFVILKLKINLSMLSFWVAKYSECNNSLKSIVSYFDKDIDQIKFAH